MARNPKQKPRQKISGKQPNTNTDQRNFIWVGGGLAAIVFIIAAVIIWQRTSIPFDFLGGDQSVIVLLRNDYAAEYQIRYKGDDPVSLERVVPMIETPRQVLHVDIGDVEVMSGDQVVLLETGGYVPDEKNILLNPGDTFDVKVTYIGRTLGGHNLFGFRLGFAEGGNSKQIDLELEDGYTIFVE